MPRYAVFGSLLESTIDLPELTLGEGDAARWRFSLVDTLPVMRDVTELGNETIYEDVHARLFRHADGLRITVDDTGDFDIGAAGEIRAAARPGAWDDFIRAHLLGRVLATALYEDGWLPLHGSAVETREGVVAFLAPKGFGKSSLALALTQAGAPLVTDDTLPIEPTVPPRAWPGVHSIRVRNDSLTAVAIDEVGTPTREGKIALRGLRGLRTSTTPQPLAAIFLLAPTPVAERESVVSRTPFSPVLAAGAVVAHVKIGRMLGPAAAATMLARTAAIVNLVPVHQLSLTRDLERLPEAARAILDWYGGPPA